MLAFEFPACEHYLSYSIDYPLMFKTSVSGAVFQSSARYYDFPTVRETALHHIHLYRNSMAVRNEIAALANDFIHFAGYFDYLRITV